MVLHIAETYHIAPWELVDNCPDEWWGYMMEWTKARVKASKKDGK